MFSWSFSMCWSSLSCTDLRGCRVLLPPLLSSTSTHRRSRICCCCRRYRRRSVRNLMRLVHAEPTITLITAIIILLRCTGPTLISLQRVSFTNAFHRRVQIASTFIHIFKMNCEALVLTALQCCMLWTFSHVNPIYHFSIFPLCICFFPIPNLALPLLAPLSMLTNL